MSIPTKPLGGKAYGSIAHLPGSRRGPGDHGVNAGQARICTERARDRHDHIVIQEKLDGSCVAVYRDGDQLIALGRAGYPAQSSPYEQHQLFAAWVRTADVSERLLAILQPGERLVGEWLAQAHGTRYDLTGREPFVAFDLMRGPARLRTSGMILRVMPYLPTPALIGYGAPLPVAEALRHLEVDTPDRYPPGSHGFYGALDPVEGLVYRVERGETVDFLAKWVRADKIDGCYLPEISGRDPVWNWRPTPAYINAPTWTYRA